MKEQQACEIVLELATENALTEKDCLDAEMHEQRIMQWLAIRLCDDFITYCEKAGLFTEGAKK